MTKKLVPITMSGGTSHMPDDTNLVSDVRSVVPHGRMLVLDDTVVQ